MINIITIICLGVSIAINIIQYFDNKCNKDCFESICETQKEMDKITQEQIELLKEEIKLLKQQTELLKTQVTFYKQLIHYNNNE